MKKMKLIIVAGTIICNVGLIWACTDLLGTSFPENKDCSGSPCEYDEVAPTCFYCGISSPGDNCTPTPGTEYSASVQHYVNGACEGGICGDGDPDGDPTTIQCNGFFTPPCQG